MSMITPELATGRSSALRLFCKGLLALVMISIVLATVYWPEVRPVVVIWLLSVAVMWRPSPRSGQ